MEICVVCGREIKKIDCDCGGESSKFGIDWLLNTNFNCTKWEIIPPTMGPDVEDELIEDYAHRLQHYLDVFQRFG